VVISAKRELPFRPQCRATNYVSQVVKEQAVSRCRKVIGLGSEAFREKHRICCDGAYGRLVRSSRKDERPCSVVLLYEKLDLASFRHWSAERCKCLDDPISRKDLAE
jgi:hypothetical protein